MSFGAAGAVVLCARAGSAFALRSLEVEAIEVHHLGPGRYEVVDELVLGIGTCVDFAQGPQLRV
jgi:hypothetical protein